MHAKKACAGVKIRLHRFLTSAIGRGGRSASLPDRFASETNPAATYWIRGSVGPRALFYDLENRKIYWPLTPPPSSPGFKTQFLARPVRSLITITALNFPSNSVDKKNQLDVTFCILYFSSNSGSTCFGQPCAHHQELTTAWCYSIYQHEAITSRCTVNHTSDSLAKFHVAKMAIFGCNIKKKS